MANASETVETVRQDDSVSTAPFTGEANDPEVNTNVIPRPSLKDGRKTKVDLP